MKANKFLAVFVIIILFASFVFFFNYFFTETEQPRKVTTQQDTTTVAYREANLPRGIYQGIDDGVLKIDSSYERDVIEDISNYDVDYSCIPEEIKAGTTSSIDPYESYINISGEDLLKNVPLLDEEQFITVDDISLYSPGDKVFYVFRYTTGIDVSNIDAKLIFYGCK